MVDSGISEGTELVTLEERFKQIRKKQLQELKQRHHSHSHHHHHHSSSSSSSSSHSAEHHHHYHSKSPDERPVTADNNAPAVVLEKDVIVEDPNYHGPHIPVKITCNTIFFGLRHSSD